MINITRNFFGLAKTIIICLTIFAIIASISSCVENDMTQKELTERDYNDFQRCMHSCPTDGWGNIPSVCMEHCFSMDKVKNGKRN